VQRSSNPHLRLSMSQQAENCEHLLKLLDKDISYFQKALSRNRYRLLSIKFSSAIMTVTIIILLGLTSKDGMNRVITTTALIVGGSIAILNARDVYLRQKDLWVKRTITTMRLKQVKMELKCLITERNVSIPNSALDLLFARRDQTLENHQATCGESRVWQTRVRRTERPTRVISRTYELRIE
jgi:hypothetical protein